MSIDTYQLTEDSDSKELANKYFKFLLSVDIATARYDKI